MLEYEVNEILVIGYVKKLKFISPILSSMKKMHFAIVEYIRKINGDDMHKSCIIELLK